MNIPFLESLQHFFHILLLGGVGLVAIIFVVSIISSIFTPH